LSSRQAPKRCLNRPDTVSHVCVCVGQGLAITLVDAGSRPKKGKSGHCLMCVCVCVGWGQAITLVDAGSRPKKGKKEETVDELGRRAPKQLLVLRPGGSLHVLHIFEGTEPPD
jgi:hypothetical protein